jgi:2-polyprenyl-3-methyl-5-hydroxy-6-metoxy-1,4-benzoquinol methylase
MSNRFDARYYHRLYANPRTRVATQAQMERHGAMVALLVRHLELPVKRILDAGCGLGWFRSPLLEAFPKATYVGLEVSEYLCEQHGWLCESVTNYRSRGQFDLIVCHDVVQYLSDREAARAIANLARLSRGALYFHTMTLEDWRDIADRDKSDGAVNLRAADWYRSRLKRYFEHAGFGLHVRRGVPWGQWELERSGRP